MSTLYPPKLIILCGGKGSRLRPLGADLPKPLVPLHGKPILQHILEFYLGKQIREFVLCVGFRAEAIRAFIESRQFPAKIDIADAGEEASMLQRLHEVRGQWGERAMVTYGDTFIDIDPMHMLAEHVRRMVAATITITDIRSPFGLVQADVDGTVLAFDEKPVFPYYIGHMVMERAVLEELDDDLLTLPDGVGLVRLFQRLIARRRLGAYRHTGLQITFNTLMERELAEQALIKFFTEREEDVVLERSTGSRHRR